MNVKSSMNPFGVAGFGLASGFAVTEGWSLPEFCWSTWLAGLLFTWGCILTAALHSILIASSMQEACGKRFPILLSLSPTIFGLGVTGIALCAGWLAFQIYNYLFAFYGLFLSVFARMEPLSLFGENGFINSDFFSPVAYLLDRYWPMALGVVVANGDTFIQGDPWKRILLPLRREIVPLHIMILALPFLSLLAWSLFGGRFQTATIVLLMGLLYLLPRTLASGKAICPKQASGKTPGTNGDPLPGADSPVPRGMTFERRSLRFAKKGLLQWMQQLGRGGGEEYRGDLSVPPGGGEGPRASIEKGNEGHMKPIVSDVALVAHCGLYCGACRAYLKGRCPGCHGNQKATWCKVRTCCMTSGYATCADCREYGEPRQCRKFDNFIARVFGWVFRSDRAACIAQIKRVGLQGHAEDMARQRRQTIGRGSRP
jgi:hypothetical protein